MDEGSTPSISTKLKGFFVMVKKLKISKHQDLSKSLYHRIDTFPHTVPSFLQEHEIKYINRRFLSLKKSVNISFNYNLVGKPISHIRAEKSLLNIDVVININKNIKVQPHKLRILQTYSLAKSLVDIKNTDYIHEHIYQLKTGNKEIDDFLVDFLVPKDKFSLAFSKTRCINTLARLFNVNEKVIQYRLQKHY